MRILRWLDKHFEEGVMAVMLAFMTIIMGVQVCARYLFSSSLTWSEEVTRYLFVWSAFLSIGLGIRHGLSLRVDQLTLMLPKKGSQIVCIIATAVELLFFGFMIPFAYQYVSVAFSSGRLSPATQIPMWVIHAAPLTGFILAVIRCVQKLLLKLFFEKGDAEQLYGKEPHGHLPEEGETL